MDQALKIDGFFKITSDTTMWVACSLEMEDQIPRPLKPSHQVNLYV